MVDRVRTRVVGCAHMGRGAQRACRGLQMGDGLICMREPENPKDRNAVKLLSITGAEVGYVQAKVAGTVAGWMDEGRPVVAKVVRPSRIMKAVRLPNYLAVNISYPAAVIWAEEPPAEDVHDKEYLSVGAWQEEETV